MRALPVLLVGELGPQQVWSQGHVQQICIDPNSSVLSQAWSRQVRQQLARKGTNAWDIKTMRVCLQSLLWLRMGSTPGDCLGACVDVGQEAEPEDALLLDTNRSHGL